jgi:multisubunit Na+/H+ antiporter MnhF subunit
MIGFVVQLSWLLVAGPLFLAKWERLSTWTSFTFAVMLVAFAASAPFKRFVQSEAGQASLPARVFVINTLSVLLVGFFLLIQLESNPHILGNIRNAGEAGFLGGEMALILVSFVVNLIAFNRDRVAAG